MRNAQRKAILEDIEERDCTFTPQLNQNSLRMQMESRRNGKHFDAVTGQSVRTHRGVVRGGFQTAADPGHEEEVFKPTICTRSTQAMSGRGGSIYNRLSEKGREQTMRKHNEHVRMLDT